MNCAAQVARGTRAELLHGQLLLIHE
jgi:hypothetical protein